MDTILTAMLLCGLGFLCFRFLVKMLKEIHGLVNSNLTTAMQSELNSLQGQLILMRKVATLTGETAVDPSIEAIEARINEVAAQLNDRYETQREVAL